MGAGAPPTAARPASTGTTLADVEQLRRRPGCSTSWPRTSKDGRYRPLAGPPGVHPEARQPSEQRPLSIPAVRDRIVQAAVKIVIEPIFEADFLPCSFGFRPETRGARCPAGPHR